MGNEETKKAGEQMGTLGGCLIEGDSEQKARERKVKRRALAISIGLQSAALVALVVTPLLAKPEKLAFLITTPMPPYHAPRVRPEPQVQPPPSGVRQVCLVCFNHPLSPSPITSDNHRLTPTGPDNGPDIDLPAGSREPTGSDIFNTRAMPKVPERGNQNARVTRGGDVQQAMLVRRVDPAYPALARQLRHSGVVHLKAIISKEGNVESLQVLDGDPLLVQSARDAVMQWHYRPTFLNGQAVEVETGVTVVYTLNQ